MAEYDPVENSQNIELTEAQRVERKKLARNDEESDIIWLMSTKQGRRFISRLLGIAGIYQTTFRMNSEMAFREGMRNVGLIFVSDIHEFCPEQYIQMMREQKELRIIEKSMKETKK